MKRRFYIFVLVIVLSGAGLAQAAQIVDRIVAMVNDEIITYQELVQTVRAFSGETPDPVTLDRIASEVLDSMIDDIVLRQEAERLNVKVSDAEVDSEIQQFKARRKMNEEEFARSLLLQGLTEEQFKEHTRQEIVRQQILAYMVRRKVVVTQEEVDAYMAQNRPELVAEKVVDLQLLIVGDQVTAEELHKQLAAGKISFDEAVARHSLGDKENGGLMHGVRWREMDEPWRVILRDLAAGDLSQAFMVQGKWVVLKLVNVREGENRDLASVEDEVREAIMRPKIEERFKGYMAGLRAKAVIEKRL